MNDAVTIVEVEQIDADGIVVIFSDGRRGRYTAELLVANIDKAKILPSTTLPAAH